MDARQLVQLYAELAKITNSDFHGDLFSELARRLYGDNFTKEQRNECKRYSFAWLYSQPVIVVNSGGDDA